MRTKLQETEEETMNLQVNRVDQYYGKKGESHEPVPRRPTPFMSKTDSHGSFRSLDYARPVKGEDLLQFS